MACQFPLTPFHFFSSCWGKFWSSPSHPLRTGQTFLNALHSDETKTGPVHPHAQLYGFMTFTCCTETVLKRWNPDYLFDLWNFAYMHAHNILLSNTCTCLVQFKIQTMLLFAEVCMSGVNMSLIYSNRTQNLQISSESKTIGVNGKECMSYLTDPQVCKSALITFDYSDYHVLSVPFISQHSPKTSPSTSLN